MDALALLLAGHIDEAVPVLGFEQLLELAAAVGVGALADEKGPRLLLQRDGAEKARDRRLEDQLALRGLHALQAFHDRREVLRRRAAAAANDVDAILADE